MIASTTLVIGVLGFSKAIYSWNRAAEGGRLKTLAVQAARRTVEDLQSKPFEDVFALYNGTAADDPVGVTIPGPDFAVRGLTPWSDDADGMAGEVVLPVQSILGVEQIREDSNIPRLGMPRDLNADGIVDALDHSADYRILPVLVRIRWQGPNGRSQVEFTTILGEFL
jgi:hypothetical protein